MRDSDSRSISRIPLQRTATSVRDFFRLHLEMISLLHFLAIFMEICQIMPKIGSLISIEFISCEKFRFHLKKS